ncbi:MAG: hypothetical protein U0228_36380 [Myxococcaceae bacterium]
MRNLAFLAAVAVVAAPVGAWAQVESTPDLRDLGHSRNMAMGGAYEAMGYGAEAVGGNPAALSLYKRYLIEATGSWDVPQGYGFGSLVVADSTNALSAGISYTFATFGGPERRWAHLTTMGLAYAIADVFHLGIAVRHHVLVGASNTNSVSMNAGLVVRPIEYLSFGFSGHNLISVYNRDVSRYFVASIAGQLFQQLSPAFDLRMDFNQVQPRFAFHGGIEWLIAQMIPVRAGYEHDGIANHDYISFGTGYFSSGSGVDIAYRHEINGQNGRLISLTLKLQL